MRAHDPLLSALLLRQVVSLGQPLAVYTPHPPLPQVLSMHLPQDVSPIQSSSVNAAAPPPPLYVFLQEQGKPPHLSSTVRAHVHLLYALLLRRCVSLCKPSYDPTPLPHISAFFSI